MLDSHRSLSEILELLLDLIVINVRGRQRHRLWDHFLRFGASHSGFEAGVGLDEFFMIDLLPDSGNRRAFGQGFRFARRFLGN